MTFSDGSNSLPVDLMVTREEEYKSVNITDSWNQSSICCFVMSHTIQVLLLYVSVYMLTLFIFETVTSLIVTKLKHAAFTDFLKGCGISFSVVARAITILPTEQNFNTSLFSPSKREDQDCCLLNCCAM